MPGSVPEYSQWMELEEGTKHYDSYAELKSPMEMFQQKENTNQLLIKVLVLLLVKTD